MHRSGLTSTFDLKGRNVLSLYISLEPSELVSEISRRFLKQFDYIWSSDIRCSSKLEITPTHTWWLGVELSISQKGHMRTVKPNIDYKYFAQTKFELPDNDRVLVISSTKQIYPGHAKRANLIEKLLSNSDVSDRLDIYGQGYKPFDDKLNLMLQYRYVLVIENECKDDYWTEKLADAFLLNRQVIYVGCTNINKYFSNLSAFTFHDDVEIGSEILNNRFCTYEVSYCAKQLVLRDYNIINQITKFAKQERPMKKISPNVVHLKPNSYFTYRSHRLVYLVFRKLKRFAQNIRKQFIKGI